MSGGTEALIPAGGAAFRGLKRAFSKTPTDVVPDTAASVIEAQRAAKETGIELFPAQTTVLPSLLRQQTLVAELPGGIQIAAKALERQNKQAYDAVEDYLNIIAPPEALSTGAVRFRSAAKTAEGAARAAVWGGQRSFTWVMLEVY